MRWIGWVNFWIQYSQCFNFRWCTVPFWKRKITFMNSVFNVISFVPFQHDLVIKTLNRKLGSWQNELMMSLTENIIMTERLQWPNHCYDWKITMTKPLLWPKDYNDQTIVMTERLQWPNHCYDQRITLTERSLWSKDYPDQTRWPKDSFDKKIAMIIR